MPYDYFWQWHNWWFFPLFMPFFWLVIIALCLYFFFGRRTFRRPWELGQGQETALDILKKLYAKGEISQEEFERMKRDILS